MTQNSSSRPRFDFWLNLEKIEEAAIASTIQVLKAERLFTKTIRDGIRLICDLREGKLDVLFELFPWVRAEFMEYMRELQPTAQVEAAPTEAVAQQTPQQIAPDAAWLEAEQERLEAERQWQEKRIADAQKALEAEREKIASERTQTQNILQQQLQRLEQLLLQQGNQPLSDNLQPVASGGGSPTQQQPKLLSVPQFSPPAYDDDEDFTLDVKKDETSGARAAHNFINSIQQLHHQ